jgi:hypothetical protein
MKQFRVTTTQEVIVTFDDDEAAEDQARYIAAHIAHFRLAEGATKTIGRFSAKGFPPTIEAVKPFVAANSPIPKDRQ